MPWASGGADFPQQWASKRWQRAQLAQVFSGAVDEHLKLAEPASPLYHARRSTGAPPPPPFLLHGTRDESTSFEPTAQLCKALRAAGG